MADKRNIDSVAFEEAIKEIASKMPKSVGDVGGVSWSDVKGRPTKVGELTNDAKYQTEAQVNATIQKVVGNAPEALDTLEEIAERLKEDSDSMVAINSILNDKANRSEIPTKYAGSASAGGAATSANKLNADAGSETQPIYFKNGVPVACGHTLSKSVPANAEFTDTVYTTNANSGILISSTNVITLDFAGTNRLGGIKTGYDASDSTTSMDYQYPGRTCPIKLDKNNNAYAIIPQKIPTDISELNNNSGYLTSVSWSDIGSKPTTIAGYGITDAKIANGVITLGAQTITPIQKGTDASKVLLANGGTINYYKAANITTATSDDGILTPLGMKNWTESKFQPIGDYLTVNTKDGVVEVGRYFDFHTADYFGKDGKPTEDYTVRIDGGTTTDKRVFTFPATGGTFATESFVKNNDVTKSITYRLGDGVSATSGNKRWIRIAKATDANASALINLCNGYYDEDSDCVLLYVNKGYNINNASSIIQQLGGRGGTKIFTKARWVVKSHTDEAYLEVYYDCTSGRNTLYINATNVYKMSFYTTPTDGEIPSGYRVVSEIDLTKGIVSDSFKKIGGTSSQFLKADGSVDSNTYVTSDQANIAIQNAYNQACDSAKHMIQTDAVLRSVNGYIQMQKDDAMFFNSNTGFALHYFACEDPLHESDMPGYVIEYLARTNSVYIQTLNYSVDEAGDLYFNNSKVVTEENQKTLLPIAIEVREDGGLYVVNHEQLTKAGLVPYIFRKTKKSNSYRNDYGSSNNNTGRHYNVRIKGWNVRGFRQSTRIGEDGRIEFTSLTDIRSELTYYSDANSLVDIYKGCVGWGNSHILLGNYEKSDFLDERKYNIYAFDKYVVLHFGIAFGKPIKFGKKITLADMSTPLAQFTLRPKTKHRILQNPKGYPFLGFRFSK